MNDLQHTLAELGEVDSFNAKFAAIAKGEEREFLYHSFWSKSEIEASLDMKSDWEVSASLIPFYGDWHDLFCFDLTDGTILEIDDSRATIFSWPSFADFKNSLIAEADWIDTPPSGDREIISGHLDF
jgi:hypothetical protein